MAGCDMKLGDRRRFASRISLGLLIALVATAADAADRSAWPEFRAGQGNAGDMRTNGAGGVPISWSETENITWKTAIPHLGWSTPVIMDNRIWLTSATEAGNDFYLIGINAETGKIFYNKQLFHSDDPDPLGNNVNGYASPSAALEPGRVYVHFGSYGTACLDSETFEVLWRREDLECQHWRGPGSSVVVFEDLLILSFDGADTQYMTALDKRTGKTVWRTDRSTVWTDWDENGKPKSQGDFRKAFSTPIVADVAGKPLLLSVSSHCAFGYDPYTGREIWKLPNESHSGSTSPVVRGELGYVVTGFGKTELRAVRLDGEGDVSDTHVKWRLDGNQVSNIPSPVIVDDLIYVLSDRGIVTCLDADTGEEIWTDRIGGNYMASLTYADGRLYFLTMQGKATVLEEGRTFKVLAKNELDAGILASPVVLGDSLILRTETHLYRIDSE